MSNIITDFFDNNFAGIYIFISFDSHDCNPEAPFISNHIPSKVWDKINHPSQTLMAAPLKFMNGQVISPHTL